MVQDVQQSHHMFLVTAVELRLPYVVDNHVTNFFAAMLQRQKVLGKCRRSNLREVFVLCDGEHLLFSQAAQPKASSVIILAQ